MSAANQGMAEAQCALGAAYYKGEGVIKNKETSLMWMKRSAKQGFEKAQEILDNWN